MGFSSKEKREGDEKESDKREDKVGRSKEKREGDERNQIKGNAGQRGRWDPPRAISCVPLRTAGSGIDQEWFACNRVGQKHLGVI